MAPVINQKVSGGAVITTVSTPMTPSVPGVGGTFTILDNTGYPAGRQTVVLDRTETNEEKILGSLSGTTFTVEQRGYDNTVASTHTAGQATCSEPLAATIVTALIDHVDGGEANPHSGVLLNNAAHDIEARHQFGAAYGNPSTPTAITIDLATATGTGDNPAKEDHRHGLNAASAGTITNTNAKGVAATVALSDHNHAYGNLSIPTAAIADGAITLGKIATADFTLMFPPGVMWFYGGTAAPFGWLMCDGSAVSRTGATALLFGILGTAYGVGDGATTFNLPDMRGRFPLGVATSGTGSTRGGTGGTIDHVHALNSASSFAAVTVAAGSTNNFNLLRKAGVSWTASQQGDMANVGGLTPAQTTGAQLGGNTDVANAPFQTANWIIKT